MELEEFTNLIARAVDTANQETPIEVSLIQEDYLSGNPYILLNIAVDEQLILVVSKSLKGVDNESDNWFWVHKDNCKILN